MSALTEETPCLVNFFIFDTLRNFPEDEEYKSIIYYHPPDTLKDIQLKETGKTAAILKFSQTFRPNSACHSLHTKKTRQYFHEPEYGFCMAMTIKLPVCFGDQTPDEAHDKVYESLLLHSYHMFCLFMGTMKSAVNPSNDDGDELEPLKIRAAYFFSKHLPLMPIEDADLADSYLGIQFLPLDKLSFLKVQSMVSHIEQVFPCVNSTTVLYQDQVIWTGLCQDDIRLLYNYLTTALFPAANLSPETRYLTGPVDIHDDSCETRLPRVFLNHHKGVPDECHLVVYRVSGVSICLLVSASTELEHQFFVDVDTVVSPRMTAIGADVVEQSLLKRNPPSVNCINESVRFLYFNQLNMAFKSTLHQSCAGHRRVLHCQPPTNNDVIQTCADLSEDLSSWGEGEIVVKTKNDLWVLGKLSNQRHLYVVVTRKNAELIEICGKFLVLGEIYYPIF